MGIRLPLRTVLDHSDNGTSSIATGTIRTFTLPQDAGNVLLKLTASITGGGLSAYLQTTDDGGVTWFDVGRTSVVSDATSATAEWLSTPVEGQGMRPKSTAQSVLGTIGSAAASTVGIAQVTGLPILGPIGRVVLSYSAAGTANTVARVQVRVNSQAARN